MSWDTRVSGEITITPPLPYAAFRDSEFRAHRRDSVLMLIEDNKVEETPTGVNHDILAVGIDFRFGEEGRHYGVKEELIKIVQRYPDHEYTGALMLVGPELDVVRYRVVPHVTNTEDGPGLRHEVIEDKAVMTWPDGTKVEF